MRATWLFVVPVVLQESPDASCAPVQATGDLPGWLICQADAHAGLIVAVGTLGLFVVAVLRLRRSENGPDGRPDVDEGPGCAAARVAKLAFPVRRTLAKSLGEGWRLDDHFMYRRDRASEIQRGFVEHEPRVEDMLDEANVRLRKPRTPQGALPGFSGTRPTA